MGSGGWIEIAPGCATEFRDDARPHINWKHIDGPMLVGRNGQLHWLNIGERLLCAMKLEDAFSLEMKHWPEFVNRWNAIAVAAAREVLP